MPLEPRDRIVVKFWAEVAAGGQLRRERLVCAYVGRNWDGEHYI